MSENTNKPLRLTGFYTAKSGYRSIIVDEATAEKLWKISAGAQIWLYENTKKEKETQPDYNLVFYTPEQVESRRREFEAQKASKAAELSAIAKPREEVIPF